MGKTKGPTGKGNTYERVPGGRKKSFLTRTVPRWERTRSPVAKHAGINKAVTHPDKTKTLPRFKKHKLNEAMSDE
jgi:hypothetical protein